MKLFYGKRFYTQILKNIDRNLKDYQCMTDNKKPSQKFECSRQTHEKELRKKRKSVTIEKR